MMPADSVVETLRASKLGQSLDARALQLLSEISITVRGEPGMRLFEEGAPADALWVIESGTVSVEKQMFGHADARILTLGAGDVLGWSSLLGFGTMTATAVLTRESTMLKLPEIDLRRLFSNDLSLGLAVMQNLSRILADRLTGTRVQLLDMRADCALRHA